MQIADLGKLVPDIARRLAEAGPRLHQMVAGADVGERARQVVSTQLDHVAAAARRWEREQGRIRETRRAIENGLIEEADSPDRLKKWAERQQPMASRLARGSRVAGLRGLGRERKLGRTTDFVSIEFFEHGLRAAEAVGRIETPVSFGTGFLVGKDLALTNNHVLDSEGFAEGSTLVLDAEENRFGDPKQMQAFRFRPDRFFATDRALDFTFVAVEPQSDEGAPLGDYGHHPLIAGEGKIRVGESVNLVQHPGGGPKHVVVHDSQLIFLANDIAEDAFCFYTSDTDEGSSGAPVFNNRWEVIALHHASVPKTDDQERLIDGHGRVLRIDEARKHPERIVWIANEGVRVSRLVRRFRELELDGRMTALRDELLALWDSPAPRHAAPGREARPRPAAGEARRIELRDGETTIPLSITIRIGD